MRNVVAIILLNLFFCISNCFIAYPVCGQDIERGIEKEMMARKAMRGGSGSASSNIVVTVDNIDMPNNNKSFLEMVRARLNRPIAGLGTDCLDDECSNTIIMNINSRKEIDNVIEELHKLNLGDIFVPVLAEEYYEPVSLTVRFNSKEKVYYDPPAPAVVIDDYSDYCRSLYELCPGPGPDYYGTEGSLHKAAWEGNLNEVRQRLNHRENVNDISRYGFTPLFLAADNGHLGVAQLLVEKGANVNAKNSDGLTPLHGAVLSKNEALVKLLLEKGAKVNVKSSNGRTPLGLSVCGPVDITELLLKYGSYIKTKNQDELNALFHRFILAGRAQDMAKIAELFIRYGADVNARNNFRAELLNYDAYGDSPLHAAAKRKGGSEAVELLVAKGADVNAKDDFGNTPLQISVASGNYRVAESLLKNGAEIKVRDKSDKTVLHQAAQKGAYNMSEMLIKYGSDVNAKNKDGWTPLHATVLSDSLFRHGRAFLKKGKKPQGFSKFAGHYEIAELLLKNGANINAVNNNGTTALNLAAQKGYYRMVELFLKKGADVNISDNNGCTPLCAATKKGDKDIVELLKTYGAK